MLAVRWILWLAALALIPACFFIFPPSAEEPRWIITLLGVVPYVVLKRPWEPLFGNAAYPQDSLAR